jgi:predicted HicB family RNase H-like nuclease
MAQKHDRLWAGIGETNMKTKKKPGRSSIREGEQISIKMPSRLGKSFVAVDLQSGSEAAKAALRLAKQMQTEGVSWVEANNRLYGVGGVLTQLSARERNAFFQTKQAAEITEILEQLPEPKAKVGRPRAELNGKILARVPKSVHAALLAEAEAEGVSLNQLIVSKLSVQLRAAV